MAKEWTPFRREVRARLMMAGMSTQELADRINQMTGRHYDVGYLAKVCDGERWSPCAMEHICRLLEIPFPSGYWKKGEWHGEVKEAEG